MGLLSTPSSAPHLPPLGLALMIMSYPHPLLLSRPHSVIYLGKRRTPHYMHTLHGGKVIYPYVSQNRLQIIFTLILDMQIHAPILIVITLFPLSTALVLFCLSTLPVSISWPQTITDVATLGRELHGYSQSGIGPMAHVVGVLSVTAVWKHTWSIPGSVIWVRIQLALCIQTSFLNCCLECSCGSLILSSTRHIAVDSTDRSGFYIRNTVSNAARTFHHPFLPTCS